MKAFPGNPEGSPLASFESPTPNLYIPRSDDPALGHMAVPPRALAKGAASNRAISVHPKELAVPDTRSKRKSPCSD